MAVSISDEIEPNIDVDAYAPGEGFCITPPTDCRQERIHREVRYFIQPLFAGYRKSWLPVLK